MRHVGQTLTRPLSIEQFSDGQAYSLPHMEFFQPHLFSQIASADEVVTKLPSPRGWLDYQKFIKRELRDPDDIRRNEPEERFANLHGLLGKYPEFRSTLALAGPDKTHYLLVHRLQYARLRGGPLAIPESRFVLVLRPYLRLFSSWQPVLIQRRVKGVALWDMYDHDADTLRTEWMSIKPAIAAVLARVMSSGLRDHVNWNIENLIFDSASSSLYYVDLKPSTLFARSNNEQNIRGIEGTFL